MKSNLLPVRTALIVSCAMFLNPLFAQQGASAPMTITINPTRVDKPLDDIPAAVSQVGQDDIQLGSEQLGLDEALKQIPGLFVLNRYNFAQDLRASIRGFGARAAFGIRGIKIIVDGIPETLADGQGSIDGVDIGSARSITVIRGPASSLYGNASGGAILVETEQATGLPFAEFRLTAGEYGYTKPQVKVGGGSDTVNYLLNLSDTSLDGYRDHSDFENTQLNGRFDFKLSDDASLLATLHYTDQPVANDPGGITAQDAQANPQQARAQNVSFDAGEALEQTRIGLLHKTRMGEGAELETRVYHTDRDFSNRLPLQNGGIVDLQRSFVGGGVKYIRSGDVAGRVNRVAIGVDYDRQDDDRKRFNNLLGQTGALTLAQNELVTSLGIFVQNETRLTDSTELTLGLRYDDVEFDVTDSFLGDGDDSGKVALDHVSPMIGLSFKQDEQTRYYATISNAFETPTTTEFANPTGGGFNPVLDPQESMNYEVGLKRQGDDHRFEVAVFHIDIDDELTPFELAAQPGRTFFRNAGSSSRDGVEIAFSRKLTPEYELALAYTWSDFKFERFTDENGNVYDGKQTPGIPEHLLQLDLSWKGQGGYYAELKNTYTGELYANNSNSEQVSSSVVSDLRVGYSAYQGKWEFTGFLGINNLADEFYYNNIRINAFGGRYYEPAPDRNTFAGFTLRRKFTR